MRARALLVPGKRLDDGRVVSYDRVIAVCYIGGRRIGDLMREAGVEEGGR